MKSVNRTSNIAFVTLLLFTIAVPAHAYVDPGTGSFAIQVLIASALGALFAVKSFWGNLKTSVAKVFGRKQVGTESPTPDA